jgi:hypothetical protein
MLEFTSTCYAVDKVEEICKKLVKKGAAECVKEPRPYRDQHTENRFNVDVYKHYLIKITHGDIFLPWEANIRFWYDRRQDRAGIKLSVESLLAILNSMTVINLLQKLDLKLGGGTNGKMALDKIAEVLTKAMTVYDEKANIPFEVTKKTS